MKLNDKEVSVLSRSAIFEPSVGDQTMTGKVILLPLLHNFLHLDLGSLTQATTYHMFGNKPFLSYLTYMDTLSSVTLTNGLQTKCQGIRQTRL